MTLPQFVVFLDAVEQEQARDRSAFVTDMSVVVSGMFAKKGTNPIADHLKLLSTDAEGATSGNGEK